MDPSDDELIQIDNCIDTLSSKMIHSNDFQRLQNNIVAKLTKITQQTNDFETLVRKLGTSEDSPQLRERCLRLQNETKSLMQETNSALRQLHTVIPRTEADKKRKQSLVENVSKQYLALLNRFQEAQRLSARKEQHLGSARASSNQSQTEYESEYTSLLASPELQLQQQTSIPIEDQLQFHDVADRRVQMHELERNIVEVNELFRDVARLVHDSGDMIDNIELATAQSETNIALGTQDLGKAVSHKNAARHKKIILITIFAAVLFIVALSLYLGLRK